MDQSRGIFSAPAKAGATPLAAPGLPPPSPPPPGMCQQPLRAAPAPGMPQQPRAAPPSHIEHAGTHAARTPKKKEHIPLLPPSRADTKQDRHLFAVGNRVFNVHNHRAKLINTTHHPRPLTIGDGLRIGWAPRLGPRELALFTTRELSHGDWTFFDGGIFCPVGPNTLQETCESHALRLEKNNRNLLLGVKSAGCPDTPAEQTQWLKELNNQGFGLGGGTFANAEQPGNAERRANGKFSMGVEVPANGGGAIYSTVDLASNPVLAPLAVLVIKKGGVPTGGEIVWDYTVYQSAESLSDQATEPIGRYREHVAQSTSVTDTRTTELLEFHHRVANIIDELHVSKSKQMRRRARNKKKKDVEIVEDMVDAVEELRPHAQLVSVDYFSFELNPLRLQDDTLPNVTHRTFDQSTPDLAMSSPPARIAVVAGAPEHSFRTAATAALKYSVELGLCAFVENYCWGFFMDEHEEGWRIIAAGLKDHYGTTSMSLEPRHLGLPCIGRRLFLVARLSSLGSLNDALFHRTLNDEIKKAAKIHGVLLFEDCLIKDEHHLQELCVTDDMLQELRNVGPLISTALQSVQRLRSEAGRPGDRCYFWDLSVKEPTAARLYDKLIPKVTHKNCIKLCGAWN